MIAVTFCQRLRELRLKRNFKQEYVALCLGISQPSYCRLEKGVVDDVSLRMIDSIVKLYKVAPAYLFSGEIESRIDFPNRLILPTAHSPQPTAHSPQPTAHSPRLTLHPVLHHFYTVLR
jgi:transcriptional regulator with XRE-family HTH domain